jgi:hypothetical protein
LPSVESAVKSGAVWLIASGMGFSWKFGVGD